MGVESSIGAIEINEGALAKLIVWDHEEAIVPEADFGVAPAHFFHKSLSVLIELQEVAHLDGSVHVEEQTGEDITEAVLEGETNDDASHGATCQQRADINTPDAKDKEGSEDNDGAGGKLLAGGGSVTILSIGVRFLGLVLEGSGNEAGGEVDGKDDPRNGNATCDPFAEGGTLEREFEALIGKIKASEDESPTDHGAHRADQKGNFRIAGLIDPWPENLLPEDSEESGGDPEGGKDKTCLYPVLGFRAQTA